MGNAGKSQESSLTSGSRSRMVAFTALSIAIIAVSAWVTVPFGPVPFTLQMFAVSFAILVLEPKQAIAAIAGYLVLGAIGVPLFSGMRGGIGVLLGPTGGFLWGYLIRGRTEGQTRYSTDGMAMMKLAPPSGRFTASMLPSWASTIDFTIDKPKPVPPVLRAREVSAR